MRLITDVLREIRKGRAVDQASRLLAELVRAVDETGKPGNITITLTVKPEKGGGFAEDHHRRSQGEETRGRYGARLAVAVPHVDGDVVWLADLLRGDGFLIIEVERGL